MGKSVKLYYTCLVVALLSVLPIMVLAIDAFFTKNIISGIAAVVGLVAEFIEAGLMEELLRERGIIPR